MRGDVQARSDATDALVNLSAERTQAVIRDDGAATRANVSLVQRTSDKISSAVDGLTTLLSQGFADVESAIHSEALSTRAEVDARADDLANRIGTLGAEVRADFGSVLAHLGIVEGKVDRVQNTLDALNVTSPLEVSIASAPGAGGVGQGPWLVSVTLDGKGIDPTFNVTVDGAWASGANWTHYESGVYVLKFDAGTVDPVGAHVLLVRSVAGEHEGAAATWLGSGAPVSPPSAAVIARNANDAVVSGLNQANATLTKTQEGVTGAIANATAPPKPAPYVAVQVLNETVALPDRSLTTPGVAADVANVSGTPRSDGRFRVNVTVLGHSQELNLDTGGAPLPPFRLGLLDVPPMMANLSGASVEVDATYRYQPASESCIVLHNETCVLAPFPTDRPTWLRGDGLDASLVLHARVVAADGAIVLDHDISIPLAGQALGWASGGAPPSPTPRAGSP
ncbi:MAG: hypothetical protein ACYDCK_07165 [Thermoplasmatota archaeon]